MGDEFVMTVTPHVITNQAAGRLSFTVEVIRLLPPEGWATIKASVSMFDNVTLNELPERTFFLNHILFRDAQMEFCTLSAANLIS